MFLCFRFQRKVFAPLMERWTSYWKSITPRNKHRTDRSWFGNFHRVPQVFYVRLTDSDPCFLSSRNMRRFRLRAGSGICCHFSRSQLKMSYIIRAWNWIFFFTGKTVNTPDAMAIEDVKVALPLFFQVWLISIIYNTLIYVILYYWKYLLWILQIFETSSYIFISHFSFRVRHTGISF